MKKILFVLLALVAGFSYDADAQFLKKLSKGLEKVSKEAEKVQKLLDPNAQQQDKKETESKQPAQQSNDAGSAKIQDVVWNGTSFSIPRITPDTRYLRLPDYAQVSDVHDGVFSVYNEGNGKYAFFLKNGDMLFDYIWSGLGRYQDPRFDRGACLVKGEKQVGSNSWDKKYPLTIIYKDGRVKELSLKYTQGSNFVDGLALVLKDTGDFKTGSVWVYINTAGEEVYPHLVKKQGSYTSSMASSAGKVAPLSDGLRAHYDMGVGKWGYIDAKGKVVITPQFETARNFSDGLALVKKEYGYNSKWSVIDKTGKIVLDEAFSGYVSDYRCGYFCWRDEDMSVDKFVDRNGNVAAEYAHATPFTDGYAFIYKEKYATDEYVTVIDTSFKEVGTTAKFDMFRNDANPDGIVFGGAGVASVKGGDPFVITPSGQIVIRDWYVTENRSKYWSVGTFTEDFLAQAAISMADAEGMNAKSYRGFIDEKAQFTIVFDADMEKVIDPGYELIYYPTPPRDTLEIPGTTDTLRIRDPYPVPVPIPYPIIFKNYVTVPIGPNVVEEPVYNVSVVADPPEGGTVNGGGQYKFGEAVNITATAKEGWKLSGIDCNSPMVQPGGNGAQFTVTGEDLSFTAHFIEKDSIEAIDKTVVLSAPVNVMDPSDASMKIPATAYLELDAGNGISSPYGENTSGFLTMIIDPDKYYVAPMLSSAGEGSVQAKFFFVPMRVSGVINDDDKKYLVVDGGQMMVGGINFDIPDPMMHMYLNFLMSFNGRVAATVSTGRYRIEMLNENEETGEFTLGKMERFSSTYGWLPSDDERLKAKRKSSPFSLFSMRNTEALLPSWLFSGCAMKVSPKRDDVRFSPPESWFESRSLFDSVVKNLGDFMYNLTTDAEKFWGE